MDAYSWYNHISMHEKDWNMTMFMTEHANYRDNVIPFNLKKCVCNLLEENEQIFE